MNDLKVFESADFGKVRSMVVSGEPWFVAADVCRALEISNDRDALTRLDDDEKGVVSTDICQGRSETLNCVNEPGLYALVLGSRKPEARAFKRWITHEVIPEIRKRGLYATNELLDNPDIAIAAFTAIKEEREQRKRLEADNKRQQRAIELMKPKANYYDLILQTTDAVSVTVIAKDYGKSGYWLNQKLQEMGVQYKQGNMWLLYQRYAGRCYTQTKTSVITHRDGMPGSAVNTCWTQNGRMFIYNLLKKNGIVPLIEQEQQNTLDA